MSSLSIICYKRAKSVKSVMIVFSRRYTIHMIKLISLITTTSPKFNLPIYMIKFTFIFRFIFFHYPQCLIIPLIINKQVTALSKTITVLNNATMSASLELSLAFSPKERHQSFHILRISPNNFYLLR